MSGVRLPPSAPRCTNLPRDARNADEPEYVDEIPIETPFCCFVNEEMRVVGGFSPCLVFQNISGYYPMTDGWIWGPSLAEAEEKARAFNWEIGVDEAEARRIILSSWAAKTS